MTNPQVGAQQEAEARLREDAALAAALAVFPGDGLAWEEYERAVYALTAAVEARTRVGFTELVEAQWLALTEIDAMARALIETEDGEITPARVRTVARFMRERALAAALAHLEEAEAQQQGALGRDGVES